MGSVNNHSFFFFKHKGRDLVKFIYLNNYQILAKSGSLNCPNLIMFKDYFLKLKNGTINQASL